MKMDLDRRWYSISRGESYGPGSVEVPQEVAEQIAKKSGIELPKRGRKSAKSEAEES